MFLKVAGATLAALGTPVATSKALFGAEPSKVRIKDAVRKLCEAGDVSGLLRFMADTFAVHTPDLRLVAGIVDYTFQHHQTILLTAMVKEARARRQEPGIREMLRAIKGILMFDDDGHRKQKEGFHLLASGAIIAAHWAGTEVNDLYFNCYEPGTDTKVTFDDYVAKYPERVAECRALADAN